MTAALTKAQRANLEREAAQLTEEALEIERRVQRIRRQLSAPAGRLAISSKSGGGE